MQDKTITADSSEEDRARTYTPDTKGISLTVDKVEILIEQLGRVEGVTEVGVGRNNDLTIRKSEAGSWGVIDALVVKYLALALDWPRLDIYLKNR